MTDAISLSSPQSFSAFSADNTPPASRYAHLEKKGNNRADVAKGWCQIALIVSGIATAAILSAVGILPAAVLAVAKFSLISTAVSMTLVLILSMIIKEPEEKEAKFRDELNKLTPCDVAVTGPIIEEALFRGILQGGLQWGLKRALPTVVMTVLGFQLPVASVIAAAIAGSVFGLVHASQNKIQAINAIAMGIFNQGTLFAVYGLWASCFSHIINNTFAALGIQAMKSIDQLNPTDGGKQVAH